MNLLNGVRVVEVGVLVAVDLLGRLLGDEGADVVKVESPRTGDYLRNVSTRFGPDNSVLHLVLNRNKRSVTVDSKTRAGQAIMRQLIEKADVVVTGNVGEANAALGLDYDKVSQWRPDIVYCQVTGFGGTGPYRGVPTHGLMMDELAGGAPEMIVNEQGFVEESGGHWPGGGLALGPLYAAYAVASGLVRAARTGTGSFIDVSCADAALATRWTDGLPVLNRNKVDPASPQGLLSTAEGGSVKHQHYETKDGRIILFCAIEVKFWEHFCRAVDRLDLMSQHNRELVVDFGGSDDDLRSELRDIFRTRTLDEWMSIAVEHDIAMGPALHLEDVVTDPHLAARGVVMTEQHPAVGTFLTLGNPVLVADEKFTIRPAPSHGEHTDEVLDELGIGFDERADLRSQGVI